MSKTLFTTKNFFFTPFVIKIFIDTTKAFFFFYTLTSTEEKIFLTIRALKLRVLNSHFKRTLNFHGFFFFKNSMHLCSLFQRNLVIRVFFIHLKCKVMGNFYASIDNRNIGIYKRNSEGTISPESAGHLFFCINFS